LAAIDGVTILGMVAPKLVATHLAAADIVVVEGTSTLFDAAHAGTPVLMVPGPIYETSLEGDWVAAHDAGLIVRSEDVTRAAVARRMFEILDAPAEATRRAGRLHDLVGTRGLDAATQAVLQTIGRSR
jgi:UDP-N-acetylglucosamine:LPS N-acetylglucosamine transferase